MTDTATNDPAGLLARLHDATNAHDVDAIVDCFAPEYVNETPAHPARGFTGREQVRRNWTQILQAIPDVQTRTIQSVIAGDTVWSEQEHTGTRPDGSPHLMRGIVIFTVANGRFTHARFYLEPVVAVSEDAAGVDDVIKRHLSPAAAAS